MLYSQELFEKAREIIDDRRRAAEDAVSRRLREFEKAEPRYRELRQEMIDSVREAVASIQTTPEEAEKTVLRQKERNLQAQREIRALLTARGLPEDYLETPYTCKKCGDTGSVGIELCTCFTEVLQKLAFEEANKDSPLRVSTFEDFRLDYYSETPDPQYKCSPRERMAEILSLCREYAADFDLSSQSIFMCGETGLGKTHLSLAIAGEVIRKGYKVLYNSAQNIFNRLQNEYFGRTETRGQFESLVLGCDLLILDDLGAEFPTSFADAALYNIINTRMSRQLPTVISSNLTTRGIEERYSRRVSSRIIGEYICLRFFGSDVRQEKAEN